MAPSIQASPMPKYQTSIRYVVVLRLIFFSIILFEPFILFFYQAIAGLVRDSRIGHRAILGAAAVTVIEVHSTCIYPFPFLESD